MKEGVPEIHEGCERNMNVYRQIEWGDVEEAFKECDHVREDTFYCSSQAHAALETHCAIASFSHDRKLTVWTSTQSPYYTQVLLSDVLGLREGDIKVIKPHTGGGFGGKLSLDSAQFCASLLSMKLMRPVKIVLTRAEEFAATKRRTPIHYQMKLGAKKDGTLAGEKGPRHYRWRGIHGTGRNRPVPYRFLLILPLQISQFPVRRFSRLHQQGNSIGLPRLRRASGQLRVGIPGRHDGRRPGDRPDRAPAQERHDAESRDSGPGRYPELRPAAVPGSNQEAHQEARPAAGESRHRHFRLWLHVRRHLQLDRHSLCLLPRPWSRSMWTAKSTSSRAPRISARAATRPWS